MAATEIIRGKTLSQFKNLFIDKNEYIKSVREMDLKERLLDWKPVTILEDKLKTHVINNSLVKNIGVGKSIRVTSYLLNASDSKVEAYLSYGGIQLTMTQEGRKDDFGFFLTATSINDGIEISIKSKKEYYALRYWAFNILLILLGLLFAVVPGILYFIYIIFIEPSMFKNKLNKHIWPILKTSLEEAN
jgi:hypothetical protein